MDEQRTVLGFDELNRMFAELDALKVRLTSGGLNKEDAREMFEDALLDAYVEGFAFAAYFLGEDDLATDPDKVWDTLEKTYGGVSIREKFDQHFDAGEMGELANLIDSEYHRSMEKGGWDAADSAEQKTGRSVVKVWDATLDDRTRPSHEILNGTRVGLRDYFVADDGDRGLYPGDFETAQQNANCRCVIHYEYQ